MSESALPELPQSLLTAGRGEHHWHETRQIGGSGHFEGNSQALCFRYTGRGYFPYRTAVLIDGIKGGAPGHPCEQLGLTDPRSPDVVSGDVFPTNGEPMYVLRIDGSWLCGVGLGQAWLSPTPVATARPTTSAAGPPTPLHRSPLSPPLSLPWAVSGPSKLSVPHVPSRTTVPLTPDPPAAPARHPEPHNS